ncbi:MAG: hypothetical protein ACKPKO_02465, partial [Candidatus Fonsibacter sp.]
MRVQAAADAVKAVEKRVDILRTDYEVSKSTTAALEAELSVAEAELLEARGELGRAQAEVAQGSGLLAAQAGVTPQDVVIIKLRSLVAQTGMQAQDLLGLVGAAVVANRAAAGLAPGQLGGSAGASAPPPLRGLP